MNYKETIEFLFSSLPMFQRLGEAAYKANLDNTIAFDAHLGHPHRNFRSIHVAGTNGKGSVSHMLASVLQKAGYKTGLYTSPHLTDFRERIKINGEMIPKEEVVGFVDRNLSFIRLIQPSFFEMTVALAFDFFSKQNIDIAVIETGMGGRLDSTNIITPLVSVITNIGLDHTQFLGETLEEIATEKAGIIKEGVPVVISEWQESTSKIFEEISRKKGSEVFTAGSSMHVERSRITPDRLRIMDICKGKTTLYERIITDLPGKYQEKNIPAVLQTIEVLNNKGLNISREHIYNGLQEVKSTTGLAGRWDEFGGKPLIICDTAHNREGLELVISQLLEIPCEKLHIILGVVKDKNPVRILEILPEGAEYYFTRADIPRAMEPHELKKQAAVRGLKGKTFPTVYSAIKAALEIAKPDDVVFIGGSTFVVGEVIEQFKTLFKSKIN